MTKYRTFVSILLAALLVGVGLSACASHDMVKMSDGRSIALVEYDVPKGLQGQTVLLVVYGFPKEDALAAEYFSKLTDEPAFYGKNEGSGVYASRVLKMPSKIKIPGGRVEFVYYLQERKDVLRRYSANSGSDLGFTANQFFYSSMYWDR